MEQYFFVLQQLFVYQFVSPMIRAFLVLLNKYAWKKMRGSIEKDRIRAEMVTRVILVVLCGLCLSLIESANSLRCRTGVQQADDQYQNMMQICKKRSTSDNDDDNDDNDSSSNEDDDDSSTVDLFGTRFFISSDSKFSNMQSWKEPNQNRNRGNDQRNDQRNDRRYSINYANWRNWRNAQYSPRGSNNRDFSYSDGTGRPSYDHTYNDNFEDYSKQQEQACTTQCFFNELNMVDQRGFPEQISIVQFMTRNVHNPEVQDFIEEAVIECFHYLNSDRQNKCYFSENLVTCLIDKGKERCEDWDDQ